MTTKRVLVIDDDDAIQTIVQYGIQTTSHWEVLAASSGKMGIEIARLVLPDVILLDVRLFDMDGLTVYQTLQADLETQTIPVILLTGIVQSDLIDRFYKLGVRGVIQKPFHALELSERILQLLQH